MIGGEVMFFSKTNKIIEQLELHSNIVQECFTRFQQSFEKVAQAPEQKYLVELEPMVDELSQLEKRADRIRHEVIRYLLNGGFLVDNRKSTMRLIEGLDHVADISEDIIQMIVYEKIQLPKWFMQQIIEINTITNQQLKLYINLMNKIVSDYNLEDVVSDLGKIEALESKVDTIEIATIKQVFNMPDLELAYKNQLKGLINMVAEISDKIEDLSDEVEIILASRRI